MLPRRPRVDASCSFGGLRTAARNWRFRRIKSLRSWPWVCGVGPQPNRVRDHQDYTLGSLVRDLAVPRSPDRTPLSDIQFNLERVGSSLAFDGLASEVRINHKAFANFDLFLNLIESERDIAVEIDFATDLFEKATISRWIGHLRAVLAARKVSRLISRMGSAASVTDVNAALSAYLLPTPKTGIFRAAFQAANFTDFATRPAFT
jgi:hypothetical protein